MQGWFYFHTGDRWFANFWKGKANGEGRFYTKSGDAYFGNFKDGWRHGQFFCINANGTRYKAQLVLLVVLFSYVLSFSMLILFLRQTTYMTTI